MQKSNKVEIRVTDLEKQDWQKAAGGARLVSAWLRGLANAECNRLRGQKTFIDMDGKEQIVPPADPVEALVAKGAEAVIEEKKTPLSTSGAIIACPRAHAHRPGVYCGSCKKVATKVGE